MDATKPVVERAGELAQNGALACPTTGEMLNPDGFIKQQFQGGQIIWSAKTGAVVQAGIPHASS
ncbi:LGFP repeat-containing protein [Arthrobacter sp. NPDC057013]|uniref:LGFP repeat-containing protein n=1 Tax=Arthrobacter sp. NPDC057013 TaxID=3345999 RepID=UPI003626FA91